ncbi:unnamed protein product [Medioppia subpectinata]|uniref:Elongation of very long chain fatty acids protein n=1 Tax=Medioppia subpectinata TaxID=1979941 RepID=A0A7R9L2V3_9ACAR|nr:unnamed protein product [Medioppia subpectinata]CAG2114260.1 unnamed protein product [Medioppia subpectinata]
MSLASNWSPLLSDKSFNFYYYDMWQLYDDPRSASWPFFRGGPWSTLAIIASYLYFVKVFGPELMKGRNAFDLKKIILIYNVFMVMISVWMFTEACLLLNWGLDTWGCQPVNHNANDPIEDRKLLLGWTFFITKFIELSDTVFFILRKKYSQLSGLHIIHHSMVPILVWIGFKFLPGGANAFFLYINSLVHVIMYCYYALSTFGPRLQPYLWWKKYLTKLQIIQFVLIITNSVRLLFLPNCSAPKAFSYLSIVNAALFLVLFASFYRQSYFVSKYRHKSKKLLQTNK